METPVLEEERHQDARPSIDFYCGFMIKPELEIRVLDLLPGSLDDEICCELSRHALALDSADELQNQSHEQSRPYEALSYTWGSPDDTLPITVNGRSPFLVTRNLRAALKRLRRPDQTRRLWADQICINQHSTYERNRQVRIMGKVFSQAEQVIVWLGEVDDLQRAQEKVHESLSGKYQPLWVKYIQEAESLRNDVSWWHRAWVIQEFAMARHLPVLYFGPHQVDWQTFVKDTEDEIGLFRTSTIASRFSHLRDMVQSESSMISHGWALLQTTCSDPKDKVYSMLGLLSPAEQKVINIDYDKDVLDVFVDTTRALITANGNFGILSLVTETQSERLAGLPSWAVDFSMHLKDSISKHSVDTFRVGTMKEIFTDQPLPWCKRQPRQEPNICYDLGALGHTLVFTGLHFDRVHSAFPLIGMEHLTSPASPWGHLKDALLRNPVRGLSNLLNTFEHHPSQYHIHKRLIWKKLNKAIRKENPYDVLLSAQSHLNKAVISCVESLKEHNKHEMDFLLGRLMLRAYPCLLSGNLAGLKSVWNDSSERTSWGFDDEWESYVDFICGDRNRAMFVTEKGFIGYCLVMVKKGDEVVLPYGGRHPMVVRLNGEGGEATFQGFAMVPGIMKGELVARLPDLNPEEREFRLV